MSTVSIHRQRAHRFAVLAAVLALSTLAPARAAVFTVGPPTDTACTHHSIQAAVNTAAALAGGDIVQISTGVWSGQRIVVNDSASVHLAGGYENCSAPVRSGYSTLSGAGASPAGPVVRHNGPGPLTVRGIILTGGNASAGGGLLSDGNAAVTLSNVFVLDNHAHFGGGMAALGTGAASKQVRIYNSIFRNNVAGLAGGGLYLAGNAQTIIGGDTGSLFENNQAQGTTAQAVNGGGAIYASDSRLAIESVPPGIGTALMSGNVASGHGGGIYYEARQPGFHFLILANHNDDTPLRITANEAGGNGGGIYVRSSGIGGGATVTATLMNAVVSYNQAANGGAIHVQGDPEAASSASLSMLPGGLFQPVPPCPPERRCNRIDGNLASTGSTVYVGGSASFAMERGQMFSNASAGPLGNLIGGAGAVSIDNSILVNNPVNDVLVSIVGRALNLRNSTIAGNTIGAQQMFRVNGSGASLTLHNAIAFQPGKQIHQALNGAGANLRNLLVGNGHGIANPAAINAQVTADPLFVAPGSADFRLHAGSPAIDRYGAGGGVVLPTVDLLGAGRPAAPPGTATPYDLGAYEYGAVVDVIFLGGFE